MEKLIRFLQLKPCLCNDIIVTRGIQEGEASLPNNETMSVISSTGMQIQLHFWNSLYVHVHVNERGQKEGRNKQTRSKQTTHQKNTAHPRQLLFLRKMSCLGYSSLYVGVYNTMKYNT